MKLSAIIAADILGVPEGQPQPPKEHVQAMERLVHRVLLHVDVAREQLAEIRVELPDLTTDLWATCLCCGASWPKREGEPDVMDECAVCAPALVEEPQHQLPGGQA